MQSWHFEGKAAEEMFRQEQRDQEDREKKRAEKDKPFGLLARMKATGWEPGRQLPAVDGIESDHTIDFTIIPIAKPIEWLVKPLVGLVRASWLGRTTKQEIVNVSEHFLTSATADWGDQGLTVVGRALQKHAGREGSVFQSVHFSHKTANQEGLDILNRIMSSPNKLSQPAKGGGQYIFDKTSGQGFGISRDGLFNGFRELPK